MKIFILCLNSCCLLCLEILCYYLSNQQQRINYAFKNEYRSNKTHYGQISQTLITNFQRKTSIKLFFICMNDQINYQYVNQFIFYILDQMACCDISSVIASLLFGVLFTLLLSPSFGGTSDTFGYYLYIIGWMLIAYGGFGCLYRIGICLECCKENQPSQPQQHPPFLRQQEPIYANDIHQAHIYQPLSQYNNNDQPINSSDLANQYQPQKREHNVFYRATYNQNQCTVCLESFQPNELVARLQCGHKFHQLCINDWAQKQINCPVCRIPIK